MAFLAYILAVLVALCGGVSIDCPFEPRCECSDDGDGHVEIDCWRGTGLNLGRVPEGINTWNAGDVTNM